MRPVLSRDMMLPGGTPLNNYAMSTVNYTGRLVEASPRNHHETSTTSNEENRVIKNTFAPRSVRERIQTLKEVGPRTTI